MLRNFLVILLVTRSFSLLQHATRSTGRRHARGGAVSLHGTSEDGGGEASEEEQARRKTTAARLRKRILKDKGDNGNGVPAAGAAVEASTEQPPAERFSDMTGGWEYAPSPPEGALSAEERAVLVAALNSPAFQGDRLAMVAAWGESGVATEMKRANGFQQGSYAVEAATVTGLDDAGLTLTCEIVRKGFFGKATASVREGVLVPFLNDEDGGGMGGGPALTAGEAKRRLMRMARALGRIESTALIVKIPVGPKEGGSRGLPNDLFLNNVPNTVRVRYHFYDAAVGAVEAALRDCGAAVKARMLIDVKTPELDPTMDSYRIGTMLELVRELATRLACSGLRVRVCVQGPMGRGIFVGLPLSLNGVRKILEMMDWQSGPGEAYEGIVPNYVRFGAIGKDEVDKGSAEGLPPDDVFLLIAPQNIVGFSILPDLEEMVQAANGRPLVLVNPNLEDVRSSEDTMSVRGRSARQAFAKTFTTVYGYRTLYPNPACYFPIVGAAVKAGPREPYVCYERQEAPEEGSGVAPWGRDADDDGEGGEGRREYEGEPLRNPNGVLLFERHVPRGSFDELPPDPALLTLLKRAGAKWQ